MQIGRKQEPLAGMYGGKPDMRSTTAPEYALGALKKCVTAEPGPVLIATHDYPDPDCLSAAWALSQLLHKWHQRSTIVYGGFVGRIENKALIEVMGIKVRPWTNVPLQRFPKVIFVDCSPDNGNVSLPPLSATTLIIDHHHQRSLKAPYAFADIRTRAASTSSIVTSYLLQAGIPISKKLATALYFGIKTDTREAASPRLAEETRVRKALFNLLSFDLLWTLENPAQPIEYYQLFRRALIKATLTGGLCHAPLGLLSSPEQVAEVADYIARLDSVDWVIASGIHEQNLFFSIRSRKHTDAYLKAEQLAALLGGTGGGHGTFAAGRIPVKIRTIKSAEAHFRKAVSAVFLISSSMSIRAF